jgi:Fe-S cluster assembly protein SufD
MALALKSTNSHYLANFELFEKHLNGTAGTWLHKIRRDAIARFADLGFPTTRHEEWKYTNVAPLAGERFATVARPEPDALSPEDVARFGYGGLDTYLLVFVDGHYAGDLSSVHGLPEGVRAGSLAEGIRSDTAAVKQHLTRYAAYDDDAFTALNTAFIHDGAFVYIPESTLVEKPIHLLFLSTRRAEPYVTHPRNLIVAGTHSKSSIIETYAGAGGTVYFTNTVTEVFVDENAVVEHHKIQEESPEAGHVSTMRISQRAHSNFSSQNITFGGRIVRNNPHAVLDAEGIEATLNGLYLGTNDQLIDNHTTIDHAKPHCNSHELYKGILDGNARGVFNGKIFVRVDAQKTDAKQTNQALLLSNDATIDTKPQLEIFADDVKCTHGATIGQLDDNALFYLQSRGISKTIARDILTYAFASDVIDRIGISELRDYCHHRVLVKLQQEQLAGIDQV